MSKTTIVNESVLEAVDMETGEVKQLEHSIGKKTIYNQEPEYIKLYIQDMLLLHEMPRSLSDLTYALLKRASYANKGLRVYLPIGVKREILSELQLDNMQSLTNNINKLCKGNIIRKIDIGVYQLNPYVFGRGDWKDIDNIRMSWDYDKFKGKSCGELIKTYNNGDVEVIAKNKNKNVNNEEKEEEGENEEAEKCDDTV